MTTVERWRRDVRKWRLKAAQGDGMAIHNIAVAYRVLGRARLSAQWFKKSAMTGDGDSMVDFAYCLQHGAGVRRDPAQAESMYRRAIGSNNICEASREEAMYLLSVILLRNKSVSSQREVVKLLRAANVDGDYPVASRLLEHVTSGWDGTACTCRRYLRPGLARLHCPLHRKRRIQSGASANGRQSTHPMMIRTPRDAGSRC